MKRTLVGELVWLCYENNTGGWIERRVDLSTYVGQSVEIDILAGTDDILNSNLFVDDVSLGKVRKFVSQGGKLFDEEFDNSAASREGKINQGVGKRPMTTLEDHQWDSIVREMQGMLSDHGS